MGSSGKVLKEIAERFIKNSVWWMSHPSGPVRAPGHSENIYGTEYNWKIDFGSNTFLVGNAILKCRNTLEKFIFDKGNFQPLPSLCDKLRSDISSSVEHQFGKYHNYPLDSKENMCFGTQAISTKDFINLLFDIVPIKQLYRKLSVRDLAKARIL